MGRSEEGDKIEHEPADVDLWVQVSSRSTPLFDVSTLCIVTDQVISLAIGKVSGVVEGATVLRSY
jgi:hypothetical protein